MPRQHTCHILAMSAMIAFGSFAATSQAAKVYRWVDDQGQVHFGSQPPPEQRTTAEKYQVKTSRPATPPPKPASVANEDEAQKDEEPVTLSSSIDPKKAKEYCKNGRAYQKALEASHNTRFRQEDGSFRPLTAEERAAKGKQAAEVVQRFCIE